MNGRSMRRSRNERHTSNVSVMSSAAATSEQYSHHGHGSISTTLSATHSLSSLARAPIMKASEIKELLQQRVAYLSGGKDRSGGPLIFFPRHTHDISIENIAAVLSYLATIPSKESKQRGFVIILDMENQTGQSIKALCRIIQETLPNRVHRVIVIKNDLLWERTLRREQPNYGFEVVTITSPQMLSKYIDQNQLTQEYGGSLRYNHEEWVDNRVDYEKFLSEASTIEKRFNQTEEDIARYHEYQDTSESRLRYSQRIKENVVNQPSWVLQLGNALLRRLREDAGFKRTAADREPSTEDHMRMQDHVESLLRKIQQRQQEMKAYLAQRDVQLGISMELGELEGGIKRVVDWIVGPGEKLLVSQRSIGRDFKSADQLRRDHEKFELKCTDTYGNYAELRHTAIDYIKEGHPKADDIDVQREYMDTVCRSFASRLERRRNMVICSTRFHRFAEEAFITMDTITEICRSEIPVESVQEAEAALKTLTETQEKASFLTDKAIHEGHSLLEMLGLPIKNAFGKDITPDLRPEEQHVKDLIARLQGRKASGEDLVRIRHLKLTQIIQLRTCEKDTEQAIMWLLELVEVMIQQHVDIGHTPQEAEQLKKEHEKFGFTAKESYEYGKELVKTSLGLRRSLKLDLRPNYDKAQRLESAWHRFSQALEERSSRLSVSILFHRNVDQLLFDINQLCQEVAPRVADSNPQVVEKVLGRYDPRRQAILKGYHDTMTMGQALLSRIALPVVAPDRALRSQEPPASHNSQGALLAQKMNILSDKKREMDMLWGLQMGTPEHHRSSFRRKVPDWEVVARMQEESRRKQQDGSQGGREPERIVVTQVDQQERMPSRQVQEPDLIIPIQQATQFSAPPPSQQMGPGGDRRHVPGSQSPRVFPTQQPAQFSSLPPSQQQMGPRGNPRGRPDSLSSQGSSQGYQQPIKRGPPVAKRPYPAAKGSQGYQGKVNGHIPGQGPGVVSPEETDSVNSQDDAQKRFEEWQAKVNESGDWIEVQVQDMKPKLTEVGKTLEEAERYQREHDEMVGKIAAKQPEIAALLSQADFNISTQQFYNDVYEAMAHSLGEAWRDLNRLLEKRKQLLADAVNFHRNIRDVTSQMDSAAEQFKDPSIPSTPEEVDKLLQDHEQLNQDLLTKSIAVVTEGQALLEKIKELGERAPKEETPVTLAACRGVQQAVEDLMNRKKMLEDLLSQKKKRLNQYATVGELDQELSKVSEWFEREGEGYLQRKDIGSDPDATEALMKEHDQVENAAKKVRESVDRVLAESEQLEHSDPEATEKLRDQTRAISTLCDEFMNRLDDRKKTLQATLDFYNNHDLAMNYLNRLDVQLSNLPQDPHAQAQRVAQLESAIPEITNPVSRQGTALLSRVGRNAPGAFGIEKRLQEMQEKAQELENKCHPENPQKASLRATFNDQHRNLFEWMVNSVEPYLETNNDMGDDLKTTTDFNDGHQAVLGDVKDKVSDVKILLQIPNQLSVTGDSDLATVQQRADEVDSYWSELKIRVETRVKTSSTLIKFEKLAKQLGNAMDNMDDLFTTVENQEAHQVTQSYVAHIREKWDYMVEIHFQLDSSGRNFLNEASQITNDPSLEIKRSSYYVDMTMKGFDERRRNLHAKYEIILQNLDLGQTFRSEWNQFLEDARGTIAWVSKAEADFFQDVTKELNMSPEKVGTLQAKLDQFQPTVKKATGEIEQHLTKAELLSRRGDVEDEKTLIVEELTAVHKRLTSRVTTHQVLLTLIIKFYENIDKLNKDMSKSSKQYTTAPMPEYISEAHVELQLHDDERGIINELHNATQKEGDEILNRMRTEPSVAPIRPEIEDALAKIKTKRINWLSEWEQRRLRLEAFIGTDHLKSFRTELNISLDDAEDELERRKGNYGDSPETARALLQKQQEWEPELKELGDKVDEYKSSAYTALKKGEDPDGEIEADVENLDKRWSSFCTQLDDHRDKLQKAVEFQDLFKDAVDWQNKGNDLVDDVNERLAQCKSPEEVNPLLEEVDDFLEKETPPQNARLTKLNQLAADIYGPDAPVYMSELLLNNNKIMDDLQDTNDELYQLADDLAKGGRPRGRRPEKRPAGEDLSTPDGAISPDPAKQSRFPEVEEPLQAMPTSMQESAPPPRPPQPQVDEGMIMPTHLSPVRAGVPLDQLDDTMESEPYEPMLPHQVQSVPYNVGSHLLDEYMGPRDPSKSKKRSPEKSVTPGKKGSAPFFPRVIRDLTIKEGRLATFDCIVKGEPEPDIIWLKDGARIPESTEAIMEYEDDDTCTLVLPAIQFSKAGTYTCKAINPLGEAICSAVLTVRTDKLLQGMGGPQDDGGAYSPSQAKPPKFLEAPKDLTVDEGKQCRVSCEIEGVPPPAVTWSKDGDPLSEEACRFEQDGQTYTLIMDEAELDDEGFYGCTAVNPKGRAEKIFQIKVKEAGEAPTFVGPLVDTTADDGTCVQLKCKVHGARPMKILWHKYDIHLTPSSMYHMSYNETTGECMLEIVIVGRNDEGEFLCRAENVFGRAETAAELIVEGPEPVPYAPKVTAPLKDVEVFEGDPWELKCSIAAYPRPTMTWYKNDEPLVMKPPLDMVHKGRTAKLIMPASLMEDAGKYSVRAVNQLGEVSTSGFITVKEKQIPPAPPRFTKLLEPQTIIIGKPLELRCTLTGHPPPEITWLRNNRPFPEEIPHDTWYRGGEAALRLPKATADDDGIYTCKAVNPQGQDLTSGRVTVEEPATKPVFTTKLEPQVTVPKGKPLHLKCKLDSSPNPTITWYHNGSLIPNEPPYEMYYNGDDVGLLIPQSRKEDEGMYACRAATTAGEDMTNSRAVITEHIKPQFTTRLHAQMTAIDGEPLELSGVVTGDPTPIIQWYKDGKLLDDSWGYELTFSRGEVKLKSSKTTVTDEGVFSCRAINPAGDDITSCNLIVEEPEPPATKPSFLSPLEPERSIPHATPLSLKCKVEGYPPPRVTWYKDGNPIRPSSSVLPFVRDGEASLEIPQAMEKDSGVYSCLASNPLGEDSSSCNVTVAAPPPPPSKPLFISRLPFELKLPHGDPLLLKCLVEGQPKPNINWFKDGIPLKNDPRYHIDFKDGEASLRVPESIQDDGGVYSCLATNPSGQDSTTSNVTVGAQEPPPCKPQFVSRLAPELTVPHGEPLKLSCGVEGYPPPKVTWYKDGTPLKERPEFGIKYQNGEASIEIPESTAGDAGVYSFVASNPSGQDSTSCNVLVSAPEPPPSKPNFISQLVPDLKIPHKEPLFLKALVEGYPVPNINWFKDGTLLKNNPRYEQSFEDGEVSLRVPESVQDDGGVFSCLATNLAGQDSTSCNVTVGAPEPPPSKSHFASRLEPELNLSHGVPLVLKCKAGGYPPPKMTWYKDGVPLKNEEPYQITSKDGTSTLMVPQAQEDDGGVYSCVAANPSGQDSTSCNVSVAAPEPPPSKPFFVTPLESDLHLSNGEALILKCKVTGYPHPKCTWYKDGTPLKKNGQSYEIGGRNGNMHLKIPEAFEDDGGVYSCLASNPSGQDSTSCNVSVSAPEPPPSKPHFMTRLEPELSIPSGETLALRCKVGGYPPPKTTWYKDGTPLKNEPPYEITTRNGEATLKVPQAEEDDGGVYSCLASNPSGQDSSSSNVTVAAPEPPPSKPHFISRLEPEMTIPHGEPLHLKCKVGGYPLPKTTWYIDGTPLKNVPPYEITTRGGETSLKVPQTEEGDGGVYSCLATNPSGQDSTSSNVTVEAPEPPPSKPHFTTRLEPELSLADGEPLVLKCKVGGYPPPKTTWYKDGTPLKNEPPYEITSRGSEACLRIPEAMEDDGGVYSCLAVNPSGQDSTSCNVTVAAPEPPPSKPHFTSRLEPELSLADGEPLTLKCKVGGYPPPKTTWYKDGTPLKNELPYEITSRGGEASLRIPDALEDDGGVYSCLASNPSGQDSTSCNVTVAAPEPPPSKPHFTTRLEPELSLANGEPLVLKCKVGGYPPPKTTWYKDGSPLKNELPYEITSRGGEASLRIPEAMEDDGGVYSCLATNPSGQDSTSCNTIVAAREPPPSKPHFTTRLEPELSLADGEPLVLKCKVGGYPPPKTTWYKDGSPLKNEPPYEITSRGNEVSLRIPEAMEDDGGVYSCLATNPSGQDSSSCNLIVAAPEPPPSKPHFTTRLEPELSLVDGEPLVLKCKVGGYPPPKTTWYKDGTPLKNELPYEIVSKGGEASLKIPDALEDDGGVYSCIAANPSGQDSTSCNVLVAAPEPPPSKPHFTFKLEPELSFENGEPLTLKCKVGGYPPPKTTWYKDGTPLKNEPPYEITSRGGESSLRIPEAMEDDCGVYSCLAANPSGQDSTSCNVLVAAPEPPSSKAHFIIRLEPSLDLLHKEPLMLKCKVGGYPAPKVMWYKDGTQLVNEAPYELFSDGGEQSLFFPQAEEEDGGVFSCLATNPSGQDVSSCNVTVAAPEPPPSKPHFMTRLEPDLSLPNGEPLVLKCKVGGYPPPKAVWYKDGVQLRNEAPYELTSGRTGDQKLTVPQSEEGDSGVYSCLASNPSGQDTTSCNVSVAAAEPPPSKPHFVYRLEPDYNLPDGEPMVLKCKVGGYPPPKTMWYKDGVQLKNEAPYEISTRGGEQTLKIPQAEEDDGGVYSCLATNPSGQDSTSSNVTIAAPQPPPSKPHFTSRLEPEQNLQSGEPLLLKCKVGGYPPPKITWFKDGNPLKNELPYEITNRGGEALLAIPQTEEEDGGVYTCQASNPSGQETTSASISVSAREPPPSKPHFITRLEPELNLPSGEPMVLKCKVGGYPPPKTLWYRDGVQLKNEAPYELSSRGTEVTLKIPQAQDEDSGVYSCLATNSSGQDSTSSNVTVAEPEPPPSKPHFTSRLEPEVDLPNGELLVLKCKVGGYPPPKTTWYKDGVPLKNEPPYEIMSRGGEAVMKIPVAEEDDSGVYTCMASNPTGQDTTSTNVSIAAPEPPPSKPLFLSRLEPELSLENGEPLLLKCKASGYPPPKATWYKDGTPLQNAAPYEISSSRSGETSLHIPETDEVDGGVYSCLASNPSGQDSTSCNVSVAAAEPPPSKPRFISRFEPDLRLPDGEPLTLKCKVEGYPPPKVTWYKDGVQLKNEPHHEITSRNGDNQLRVPDAQEDDGGVYSCLIANPSGQDSASCNVAVAAPEPPPSKPHFTLKLAPNLSFPPGEPIFLRCKVAGYPPPKPTWYKDGIPLKSEPLYDIGYRNGECTFKIPESIVEDGGVYSCLAANPSGQETTTTNVVVKVPEPPPSKPHFVTRLSPELNVLCGEQIVLRCKVGGYPIPKLSWFKDSEQLPSEPPYEIENRDGEGMLRIQESFENDGGVYSCLASNPSGQDSTSCSVLVTAREPPPSKPHFPLKLAPEVVVSDGEPLALRCRVGGYPLPRAAWYKDGSLIPNEPPYQITFRDGDASLTVPESQEENSGVYSCQATNSSGQESTSSNVTVSAPEPPPSKPHFTSKLPSEFKVPPEEPLLLKCKVNGYPPPKVSWYKDGVPLKNEPRYVIGQTKNGEATLHVPQTVEDDSGVYSCLASNPSGQESSSTNVSIADLEPPSSKPLFVTRLSPDLGVLSGDPVILKCKVGGYPPPKTTWYKDGVLLRNDSPYEISSRGGEHCLQISSSNEADSGNFTCVATNPSGQDKTACNLAVTATEPPPSKPHFNSRLEPEVAVPHGEPILLKCKVGGYPPPNMNWYKDGIPLKNNPDVEITTKNGESTLRVPNANEGDSGAYSCLASNPTGQESQSCNVIVSAPEPPPSKPHFTAQLVPEVSLRNGDNLDLSAKVTGYPPPRITWYKDGTPLKSGQDYQLANKNGAVSLHLPKCQQDDGGVYACLATNPSGQDSTSANVTVSAPEPPPSKPKFTIRLPPQNQLPQGESLILKTKVEGYPIPKITWYKDGVTLKNEPGSEISFKNGEACLRVPQTKEDDGGVYSCVASNPSGQDTTNCNVSCSPPEPPQTKPFFSVKMEPSLTVPQGEPVDLTCKVNAYPPPQITWLKDNAPLRNEPPYEISYKDNEAKLRIPECDAEDEGRYSCRASNAMGQDTTTCQLSVAEPELPPTKPHFTEGLEPQVTVPVDEPLVLSCKVAAHPPPQITWYRNGAPIRNEPKTQVSYRDGEATLKIPRCTKADAGMYSCLATNPHGNETSSSNVNIAVPSKPNFVTRLQQQISLPKGEPLFLQCHVVGHPTPFITWFKDGMQIRNEPPHQMTFEDGEAVLRLSEFTKKDEGVYSCQATNVHGKDSTSGQVEQLAPKKPSTKPRFTAQLKPEVNVPVGSPIELACRFTGHPAPTPSWYKDSKQLANEAPYQMTFKNGEASLRIPESFEEDQGLYQCRAVNPVGEDVSRSRVVVSALKIPPRFTVGLEPRLSVPQGNPIDLNCSAIGQPTPSLNWFKDNRPLRNEHPYLIRGEDGDSSLRIEESKKTDGGTYTCRAQNPQGQDSTSCKIHIEVMPVIRPKIISALPAKIEVPLGDSVDMDFNVAGTPQPTVKFYHDGRELRSSEDVQIEKVTEKVSETQYRVRIRKASPETAGEYTLVAENNGGQERSSVYIAVPDRRPPRFTKPLIDQTIKLGKPMVLKCQLSAPSEPKIVWTKDGKEIPDRPPHRMRYVNGEVILRMMETSVEDSGHYSVQASNEVGSDRTGCRVDIQVPGVAPRISTSARQKERMEVPAGQPINMEFQVTGTPHPRVKFYHNDRELKESKDVQITRVEETIYRLHIKRATPERAGKYTVVAENDNGKQTSSLHIDVPDRTQIKPRFSVPIADQTVQEGNPVTLKGAVSAIPPPKISWSKDGVPLKNEPPYHMTFERGQVTLRILQAFPEDEGRYTVTASNPAGQATSNAVIRVKVREDEIPLATAPSITATETQEVQIQAGEPVELEFKVSGTPKPRVTFYKDEEILRETEDIQIIRREGAYVLFLKNPHPSMSGRYKVVAENERGIETAFITIHVTEPQIRAVTQQTLYTQAAPQRYQNPPIRIEEFTDQETVTEISQIKLRVKIDGPPTAKVTWYRNGIVIPKTGRSVYEQLGQEYFLIIHKPTPEDSGMYKMVASTERGTITSECRVSVTERIPPDFLQPLDNKEVEEGTTLRLECRIVGTPDPEVKWTKDDRPLVESARVRTLKDGDVCSLLIINFKPEDAGNYKVSLTNPYGMSVSSAILALRSFRRHSDRHAITQAPRDLKVRPGEKVEISFNIRGETGQEVIWFKDGTRISGSDKYQITTTDHKTSLLINEAKAEDSGEYSTLVKTRVGDATFVVRLHVDITQPPGVAPHFVKPFGNKKAYEGERVVFEGVITGEPEPNVSWFKNGVAVEPGVYQIVSENPRHSLTIAEVIPEDAGVYECRAGNDYGEAVCVATLKLRGASKPVAQYEEYSFSESTWTEEETHEVGRTVYMPRREF